MIILIGRIYRIKTHSVPSMTNMVDKILSTLRTLVGKILFTRRTLIITTDSDVKIRHTVLPVSRLVAVVSSETILVSLTHTILILKMKVLL